MALEPGARLGSFEITGLLGVGGMGEVYRARDTKLGRDVAIKVLPGAFAADPDRLARFKREARVLASLDHPNVGAIYDLQEAEGTSFIVMQLVEGETLADRLSRGPLSVKEALPIFAQIAEALEAAHEKDIIHRDLKPANVKVTEKGPVKVIDFGLAKYFKAQPSSTDETAMTLEGVIVGTPTYMSPEQARGKTVDKRTDIWAFGCCLYESLTGKVPFKGETLSDTLGAILECEPDWTALPQNTPAKIRDLIRRCLQKDPRQRLHDIADARIEIGETLTLPSGTPTETATPRAALHKRVALGLFLGLMVGTIATAVILRSSPSPSPALGSLQEPKPVRRLSINIPPTEPLRSSEAFYDINQLALSPDGKLLVYVSEIAGQKMLVKRWLDLRDARPMPGTEGAEALSFSPDSKRIAFITDSDGLKIVSIDGGPATTLCDGAGMPWVHWGEDDFIYFMMDFAFGIDNGLFRILATDVTRTVESLTVPGEDEWGHGYPFLLPGGEALLFSSARSNQPETWQVEVLTLKTRERKVLVKKASAPRYAPTGHLIYVQSVQHGKEMVWTAAPFDVDRLELTGPPVPIPESGLTTRSEDLHDAYCAALTLSPHGTLVYVSPVAGRLRTLVWVDREGNETPLQVPPRLYASVHLSPDGTRLAVGLDHGEDIDESDIWIYNLTTAPMAQRRLHHPGFDTSPLWTIDGRGLVFSSSLEGRYDLYRRATDETDSVERLTTEQYSTSVRAMSWRPDGHLLTFVERSFTGTRWDLCTLTLDGEHTVDPLLVGMFDQDDGFISPDGQWLVYESDETGRSEVYVWPFPEMKNRMGPISLEGGDWPLWARDGKELFYWKDDMMMKVDIETEPMFTARNHRMLFQGKYVRRGSVNRPEANRSYDVSPDGQRFLMVKEIEEADAIAAPTAFMVVENWFEELKRIAPVGEN